MKPLNLFAIGAFASLSCVIGITEKSACLEEQTGKAKDLFIEQLKNPGEPKNAGIKYWIELRRNGSMSQVDEDTVFRRGDKIRLHVTSNINGYGQVVLRKGSSGKSTILFPIAGQSAKVTAGKEFRLPAIGFLEFDEKPGKEVLVVAVAQQPNVPATLLTTDRDEDSIRKNFEPGEVQYKSGKPKDIFYSAPTAKQAKLAITRKFRSRVNEAKSTRKRTPSLVNSSFIVCEGSSDLISEMVLEHK